MGVILHLLRYEGRGRYFVSKAEADLTAAILVREGKTVHQQRVEIPTEPEALARWMNVHLEEVKRSNG